MRDKLLGLFECSDVVLEKLKALTLKLFELASLIYLLYKIVQHLSREKLASFVWCRYLRIGFGREVKRGNRHDLLERPRGVCLPSNKPDLVANRWQNVFLRYFTISPEVKKTGINIGDYDGGPGWT